MTLSAKRIEERRSGIGGSDIGAVLGLNKYKTPVDVYLEKTGQIESPDLSDVEAVHFGNVLEDVIAKEYARRTGQRVRKRHQHFQHPDYPWALANIDRSVDGAQKILECKNTSEWMSGHWGDDGTDEVPEPYLVQVAWYMAILRYEQADLAALIGGNRLRIYQFERDLELEEMLLSRAEQFWRDHVLKWVPPPPTCERDLQTLYAIDNGTSLVATEAIERKARQLSELKDQIKTLQKQADDLKLDIRAEMGKSSELLLGADGTPLCTWKSTKPREYIDSKRLKDEQPDVYKQYSKQAKPSRMFLLKI